MGFDVKFGMGYVTDYATGQMSYGYGPQFSFTDDAADVARTAARERIVVRSGSEAAGEAAQSGSTAGLIFAGIAAALTLTVVGVALLRSHGDAHTGSGTPSNEDFGPADRGNSGGSGPPTGEDF